MVGILLGQDHYVPQHGNFAQKTDSFVGILPLCIGAIMVSYRLKNIRSIRNNQMMQRFRISIPEKSIANGPGAFRKGMWISLGIFMISLSFSTASAQSNPPVPDTPEKITVKPIAVSQTDIKPRQESMATESRKTKRRKPARTQGGTLTGARLIPFRSQAIRATIGFPDIEVAYHFPYSPEIELIPRLQIAYGRNLSTSPSIMEFGSDARKEIYRKGKWTVAGFASAFAHLNMNNADPVHYGRTSGFGLGLGCPGVIATYAHNSDFDINLGVQIQDILYFGDNAGLELNIPFSVGFEYAFSREIRMIQRTEFGPDIYVGEGTDLHLRTFLGAGYRF